MKESLALRLAGLATSLGRISSSARREAGAARVVEMLEECQLYIEWTAGELDPEAAAEMVDIQVMISMWRKSWAKANSDATQRSLLSFLAKKWSDRALDYSGLLS
jgi:hypothetical protein